MRSITWSGRRPGNEAIGTCVIYSESEEAAASFASMLGMSMMLMPGPRLVLDYATAMGNIYNYKSPQN